MYGNQNLTTAQKGFKIIEVLPLLNQEFDLLLSDFLLETNFWNHF